MKDQSEHSFDDRSFMAMHPAFERALIVRSPVDRNGSSSNDQRNDEQVLIVLSRPINGDPDFSDRRNLRQRLMREAGQSPRRQSRIMNQSREPLASGLLIALSPGQLCLAAGFFFKDRRDEDRQRFELMTMCPGQGLSDIVL
ncbi:MAG TPA: hypothetical protein VJ302_00045 [Blastocatellia bacterium]|nr:hypothetical protein [Blastocatellia bacterium]